MRSSTAGKARKVKGEGETFATQVLEVVRKIPRGKVLTYGQVAALVGSPRAARIVGGVLFRLGKKSKVPWQRVLNARGMLSTYRVGCGEEQKKRLQAEGLRFNRQEAIELERYQWWPTARQLKAWRVDDDLAASIHQRFGW
ncbi:MAG: methylated-DNA--[protein]-cysteine S-methyltransferase [Deltaproteobacteria bacterium]|nr:methylated-DNA--[protein]-cysteine S-methyltransferase [Deltaproteobacteria bacterium]